VQVIKVLFTGGGGAGNEALYRLLGKKYNLHFGDADETAIDPSIPKNRRHELPWASDSNFIDKIAKLCRRLDIDLLVPGVDEELHALALNADLLAPTRLLLPDALYVETMLDKLNMINSLKARKIQVPLTYTLADDLHGICFPCISKPRRGRGSRDVHVLQSHEEARALKLKLGSFAEHMLIQEKIEGVEYTVQMLADSQGRLYTIVPVRVGIKRGITLRAETDAEPSVISACHLIHEAFPTSGCYNIQLIMNQDGIILPFEINPRISTTLCLVVAAGIDPISIFHGDARQNKVLTFVAGIQLQRHWSNHFSHKKNNEICSN